MSHPYRWRRASLALGIPAALLLAACSSGGSTTSSTNGAGTGASIAPVAATNATCQSVQLGPITRCENFYTAYWPVIEKNMAKLYAQAKATDGGQLVVWDWYPLPAQEISMFEKAYPGITITTRGLNFNLGSAIVTAKATGARNSDIVKGSITTMTQLYDAGYWQKVNWASFGVPSQFLQIGGANTGLLPDSIQTEFAQYNTTKQASAPPTALTDYTSAAWHGKLVTENYEGYVFAGYGLKYGQSKMVSLIKQLKSTGNLTISSNDASLLSTGENPVDFAEDLGQNDPSLAVSPIQYAQTYVQFIGVNSDAANKPAAELFALWEAYAPDWINALLTSTTMTGLVQPYPGLPSATFAQATGVMKANVAALNAGIANDDLIFESWANRNELNTLDNAADNALG
jgi:putative spermidine/putrescine transport system substrate-binding protein